MISLCIITINDNNAHKDFIDIDITSKDFDLKDNSTRQDFIDNRTHTNYCIDKCTTHKNLTDVTSTHKVFTDDNSTWKDFIDDDISPRLIDDTALT